MTGQGLHLADQTRRFTLSLLESAGEHFGVSPRPVDIRFDLRGKAAGMVRFVASGMPVIRYNRRLLEKYGDSFIRQTVPHEVAHVVVSALFPYRTAPHGQEWRSVMAFFDAEHKRCHSYQIDGADGRQLARFSYRCGCRVHQLTAIRRNRIARGQRYYCRHCGELLIPEKTMD